MSLAGLYSGGRSAPDENPGAGLLPALSSGGGTTWADRTYGAGVKVGGDVSVNRQAVSVGGQFSLSGLMTIALLVGAAFALERYGHLIGLNVDVPGVKGK